MPRIQFTPSLELDTILAPGLVTVKGQSPRLDYPFKLLEIYPQVPSLDLLGAYNQIRRAVDRIDHILSRDLNLRPTDALPHAADQAQASEVLSAVFDPRRSAMGVLDIHRPSSVPQLQPFFCIELPRPFALERAGAAKLLHTLAWIDTNIKVQAEHAGAAFGIADNHVREIAESALIIYSLLVKMQDFRLALKINFNHSMFLQDRILNLLLGDALYVGAGGDDILSRGTLSNQMALQLLRGLGRLSERRLCTASLFMGTVWTSSDDVQENFERSPETALAQLESGLKSATQNLAIDHIDDFLRYAGGDPRETLLVVLDDNGESAFDLALCQELLRQTHHLTIDLLVNRYPVSNNISLPTLDGLLQDDYFADLTRHREEGRLRVVIEEQVFRSFELAYLTPKTRERVSRCPRAYVKGANFFETFQPLELTRYHCFTVHGFTSQLLTGCSDGSGVFARVNAGQAGYRYDGPADVVTLRDVLIEND